MAAKSCRGLPAELAAKLVVKVMFNFSAAILSTFRCFSCTLSCLNKLSKKRKSCRNTICWTVLGSSEVKRFER